MLELRRRGFLTPPWPKMTRVSPLGYRIDRAGWKLRWFWTDRLQPAWRVLRFGEAFHGIVQFTGRLLSGLRGFTSG